MYNCPNNNVRFIITPIDHTLAIFRTAVAMNTTSLIPNLYTIRWPYSPKKPANLHAFEVEQFC